MNSVPRLEFNYCFLCHYLLHANPFALEVHVAIAGPYSFFAFLHLWLPYLNIPIHICLEALPCIACNHSQCVFIALSTHCTPSLSFGNVSTTDANLFSRLLGGR